MNYVNEEGKLERPAVLHVAILGSFDRFLAILIEQYAGAFPLWLAPVQITLIPIAQRHNEVALQMTAKLRNAGFRVEINDKNESMQAKNPRSYFTKVPYIGIIGDKEVSAESVSVRTRKGEDLKSMTLDEFLNRLHNELETNTNSTASITRSRVLPCGCWMKRASKSASFPSLKHCKRQKSWK